MENNLKNQPENERLVSFAEDGVSSQQSEDVVITGMHDDADEKKRLKRLKSSANQIAYSKPEELINIITHLVGTVLSMVGSALMIVKVSLSGLGSLAIVATCLYSFCMITMYLMSTLYHAQPVGFRRRAVFRRFDHCAVALLISGTYMPIMLIGLGGVWGISIASVVLGMAVLVIVFNAINVQKFRIFNMIAYVIMGWACIIQIVPLFNAIGVGSFSFLISGGVVYTVGIIFYKMKKLKFNHAIWHFFVLFGSILHFVSVYFFIL